MSNIEQNLEKIKTARYGEDVRDAIHDSIEDCYNDGKAGAIDLSARASINTLTPKVNAIETGEAATVRRVEALEGALQDLDPTSEPIAQYTAMMEKIASVQNAFVEASTRLGSGEYIIKHAWIDSAGVVTAVAEQSIGGAADYDLVVYQVNPGDVISEVSTDPLTVVLAYYSAMPSIGSTSYNGQRRASSYTSLTDLTVPDTVGWVAVRVQSGGSATFNCKTHLEARIENTASRAEQTAKKYDTMADVIADHFVLQAGELVQTLGYYAVGDGGGSLYEVMTETPTWHFVTLGDSPTKYAQQIRTADPVNALTVGIRGDGTNPSSNNANLFQRATAISDLYFPDGTYLFEATLLPRKNIKGGFYERSYGPATIFKTSIESGYVIKLDANSLDISIENIGIVIENDNVGGIWYRNTSYTNHVLRGINISGLGSSGVGVFVDPTVSISRYLYADSLSIRAKGNGYTSVGIDITQNGADIRLADLEIMGCQVGLRNSGGVLTGSDWHIWASASNAQSSWWQNTVALEIDDYTRFAGSNIYLDSAHTFIKGTGEGFASISNLVIWSDDHVFASNNGGIADGCKLFVHGGAVYQGDVFLYGFDNAEFADVMFLTEGSFDELYPHIPVIGKNVKERDYALALTGDSNYETVAEFMANSTSFGKIVLMLDGDACELTVSGATITKQNMSGTPDVYYQKSGNFYKIVVSGDYTNIGVWYELCNSGLCGANYNRIKHRLGGEYNRETYDSTSGLTKIS